MIINMAMNEPEAYYKMPPVGITQTRVRAGHLMHTQQTVRCSHKSCWWVGNAATTQDAQTMLDDHQSSRGTCPQAPARNELPSGYSILEKLWDELDDVTWAIMNETSYNSGGVELHNNLLRGYARGIAFTLSMMCHPHYRTIREVVIEATKRYKIRKGLIPFEPTPGYRFNPVPPPEPPVGEKQVYHGKTVEAVSRPGRTTAAARRQMKKDLAGTADLAKLSTVQANQIRVAYAGGMFSSEELAAMYKVHIDTINTLVSS